MSNFETVQLYTPVGRVVSENLLVPDTPENRKRNPQFARGHYKVVLAFPKDDAEVRSFVKDLVENASRLLVKAFDVPAAEQKPIIARRLRDGDELIAKAEKEKAKNPQVRVPTEFQGCWILAATSKNKPVAVDVTAKGGGRELQAPACYRGMYGAAEIAIAAISAGGQIHLAAWLNAFAKTADGEKLGGGPSAAALLTQLQAKRIITAPGAEPEMDPFGL